MDLTEACEFMETMEIMIGDTAVMVKSEVTHIPLIKNNHQSELLRVKANEYFKKKSYMLALEEYTKSLYYAENGSLEEKLAYANRSALLFQRGFYAECLQDIERALKNNYPEEKKVQLIQRREKANSLVSKQTKRLCHGNVPEVETKNPKIPCASEAITFAKNDKYGTFIQATRDIKLGEVLLVENPYSFVLDNAHLLQYCSECGKKCFNLIPCDKCFVLYCSDTCKQVAFEQYHEFECILERFYSFDCAKNGGSKIYENEPVKCMDFKTPVVMALKALKHLKDGKLRDNGERGQHTSGCYDEIKDLTANGRHHNMSVTPAARAEAPFLIQIAHLLTKFTDICSRFDVDYGTLKGLIRKNFCIMIVNCVRVVIRELWRVTGDHRLLVEPIGKGVYATFSRFNHACCPNMLYYFCNNTVVVSASRHIKKGEQCFICYVGRFAVHADDQRMRQTKLHHYCFTCDCKACAENWPGYPDLYKGADIVWNKSWKFSKADYDQLKILYLGWMTPNSGLQEKDKVWASVVTTYERIKEDDEQSPAFFFLDALLELLLATKMAVKF